MLLKPIIPDETLSGKIYVVRNQSIMLDFDLAQLYEVETRVLKQAVKRNLVRFPEDFMFQLTKTEWLELITICDNLPQNIKFSPAPPNAFTEPGVAMLSGVLNSERAILVNIQIIRVFTRLRRFFTENTELRLDIEKIKAQLKVQGINIDRVFQYLDELAKRIASTNNQAPRKRIGYKPDQD